MSQLAVVRQGVHRLAVCPCLNNIVRWRRVPPGDRAVRSPMALEATMADLSRIGDPCGAEVPKINLRQQERPAPAAVGGLSRAAKMNSRSEIRIMYDGNSVVLH